MTKNELREVLKKQRGKYLGDGIPGHNIDVSDILTHINHFDIKNFNSLEYDKTLDNKIRCTAVCNDGTSFSFTDSFLRKWAMNKIFEQDESMISQRERKEK